jgi:hypothetical protein
LATEQVVAYDDSGGWRLEAGGRSTITGTRVRILDGGWNKWVAKAARGRRPSSPKRVVFTGATRMAGGISEVKDAIKGWPRARGLRSKWREIGAVKAGTYPRSSNVPSGPSRRVPHL